MGHAVCTSIAVGVGSLLISFSCACAQHNLRPDTVRTKTETTDDRYFMRIVPQDTSFKDDMPMYNPESNFVASEAPEILFKPRIDFPEDPALRGRHAIVIVNVLVDGRGLVRDAKIIRSTDSAFDSYALEYAKQYRFGWKTEARRPHMVWVTIKITFPGSG